MEQVEDRQDKQVAGKTGGKDGKPAERAEQLGKAFCYEKRCKDTEEKAAA